MSNHEWIKIEITPVSVIANGDNFPTVVVDPDEQTRATHNSQYGCGRCEVSLDESTVNTLCSGATEEECREVGNETSDFYSFDEHPDRP